MPKREPKIDPESIASAANKWRTCITSTTQLSVLAKVAAEDNFAHAFMAARGKIDPDLNVGF